MGWRPAAGKAVLSQFDHTSVPVGRHSDGTLRENKFPKHAHIFSPDVLAGEPVLLLHSSCADAHRRPVIDQFLARRVVELLRFLINIRRIISRTVRSPRSFLGPEFSFLKLQEAAYGHCPSQDRRTETEP